MSFNINIGRKKRVIERIRRHTTETTTDRTSLRLVAKHILWKTHFFFSRVEKKRTVYLNHRNDPSIHTHTHIYTLFSPFSFFFCFLFFLKCGHDRERERESSCANERKRRERQTGGRRGGGRWARWSRRKSPFGNSLFLDLDRFFLSRAHVLYLHVLCSKWYRIVKWPVLRRKAASTLVLRMYGMQFWEINIERRNWGLFSLVVVLFLI